MKHFTNIKQTLRICFFGFFLLIYGFAYPQSDYRLYTDARTEPSSIQMYLLWQHGYPRGSILQSNPTENKDLLIIFETIKQADSSYAIIRSTDNQQLFNARISPDEITLTAIDGNHQEHVLNAVPFIEQTNSFLFTVSDTQLLDPDNPDSPSAFMEISLVWPDDGFSDLRHAVKQFYGWQSDDLQPGHWIKSEINEFFKQYSEMAELPGDKGKSFQWLNSRHASLIYDQHNLLGLRWSKHVFTGGAHSMSHNSHVFFHTQNGKMLVLDEMVAIENLPLLEQILTQGLKAQLQINDEEKLSDHGYFTDTIPVTDNFYLTPNGIGFYYNSYEIAPYSTGHTDLWLPFTILRPLLLPDFIDILFGN